MSLFQTNKPKSAAKMMIPPSKALNQEVLETLSHVAQMVGATLGPGGRQVLIERPEMNMKPILTKDGVTVIKHLGYQSASKQLILEAVRDAATRTAAEAGDGPQPLTSKILTPTGFVKMGDIKVGMKICGTNGSVQEVLGVFPKGKKEIYEVELENGGVVECCKDHLWSVVDYSDRQKVLTVSAMIKDYKRIQNDGSTKYKYFVPRTHVEFDYNNEEMQLDPYLVGVLLGDGSLSGTGSVEISLGKKKEHIIGKLKLPEGISMNIRFDHKKNYFRVKLIGQDVNGRSMLNIVKSVGLLGTTSKTKFIPKTYLYGSKQTREALLQGLIDTDGHINVKGLFEFSTVSPDLSNDFIELARSLGKVVYSRLHARKNDNSYSKTPIYRITELKGYKNGNKISRITPTGKYTEMQCIKVSNPDSLYITDNYVVTHNTTSATILSAAIADATNQIVTSNPRVSPQRIVRELQNLVPEIMNRIKGYKLEINGDNYADVLLKVATLSANGDDELAKAIIEALDTVGEEGNMTIVESSGSSRYVVERIHGYTVDIGYEESARNLASGFINDKSGTMVIVKNPIFLLYDGVVNDIMQILPALQALGDEFVKKGRGDNGIVLVAHGFSDTVLGDFNFNWNSDKSTAKIFPLLAPRNAIHNSATNFLYDLQAYTGVPVFNPVDNSPASMDAAAVVANSRATEFECGRFKATVVSKEDMDAIQIRVDELKEHKKQPESEYELRDLEVRIGKLTSGIARLNIYAPSAGETREKRDRAEDAWMAIKGALAHGALPGGGYVLAKLAADFIVQVDRLPPESPKALAMSILCTALLKPIEILYYNYGYLENEIRAQQLEMIRREEETYDIQAQSWVHKFDLLDSAPAVEEAICNSISIASLLGTLGGIVAFKRDDEEDRKEADMVRRFEAATGSRGSVA